MVLLGSAPSSICISYVFCSWCTVIWELLGSSERGGCGVLCHSFPLVFFSSSLPFFLSYHILFFLRYHYCCCLFLLSLVALSFGLGKANIMNLFFFLYNSFPLLVFHLCNSQKWLTLRSISQCNHSQKQILVGVYSLTQHSSIKHKRKPNHTNTSTHTAFRASMRSPPILPSLCDYRKISLYCYPTHES
jgi:hypothetical protein